MKLFCCFLVVFIVCACTGKVQTNPLPQSSRWVVPPNYTMNLKREVDLEQIESFDIAAESILMRTSRSIDNKSIWQIGIDRGHYE